MARNCSHVSLAPLWEGLQGREQASIFMEKRPQDLACTRTLIPDSSSSQTPNIQPTEMGPHPKHRSQMGDPAPLLRAPFGRAPLLLTPHRSRESPTRPAPMGNHLFTATPAPLAHVSQPWGLSLDGGRFRGRMLNCIAQLSDLQSLLLAPMLPLPYLTPAGDAAGSAPPTYLLRLPLGHLMAKGYWKV